MFVEDTTVQGNEAGTGGAFALSAVTQATIQSSKFSGNNAKLTDGGALTALDGGDLLINDVTFDENVAAVSCGAIQVDGAKNITVSATLVSD